MNRKEKKKTERVNRLNIADEILVCNNMLKFIEGILRYPAVIRPTPNQNVLQGPCDGNKTVHRQDGFLKIVPDKIEDRSPTHLTYVQ